MTKSVLQVSISFSPNIGGIETHFDDLVSALNKRDWKVTVLTYKPITTKVPAEIYETKENARIIRIPWLPGLFYKLVSLPLLEFLYLLPGLFIAAPFVIILNNPDVIHAHGLVAGFVAVFWGNAFGKKVVVSTHSIYHFPEKGLYTNFVRGIFKRADKVLTLSKQSGKEIESLGIDKDKIGVFTYWIDLDKFKSTNNKQSLPLRGKQRAKNKVNWKDEEFVVLFVGRLVEEKGVNELLKAAKIWNDEITLAIIGSGPLESKVKGESSPKQNKFATGQVKVNNVEFLGTVDNDELPDYYNAADLLIVPSTHEEGFGRVILEALACGTPVIGANRGAIPEAMDESVGKLIDVTPANIKEAVEYFYNNPDKLEKLSKNARKFAEKRYSDKNVEKIIKSYKN